MSILNIAYKFFNRKADASKTRIGDWIDWITDENDSNLKKTKDNFIALEKEAVTYKQALTGDGIKKEFIVAHGLSKSAPRVTIIHRSKRAEMFPRIEIVDQNSVKIAFLNPLSSGVICDISIH